MEEIKVLVVQDEDGEMRPLAGIWKNNEAGTISAKKYMTQNPTDKVIMARLIKE
jgi:hypothetical protein